MEAKALEGIVKDKKSKGLNNRLRKEGRIPAVMYGHSDPCAFSISHRDFSNQFKGAISENTIIELTLGKKKHNVLVKDFQEDLLKGVITHIDFYEIEKGKALKTHVPIKLEGRAPGVREGGLLEVLLHEAEVECLPKDLPESIIIDISSLNMHDSIHISDLKLAEGIKVLNADDQVIVHVTHAKDSMEATSSGTDEEGEEAAAMGETAEEAAEEADQGDEE